MLSLEVGGGRGRGRFPPPLVVDIGAHFGSAVSLFALARGARVLAVEMQPLVARALRASAAINGWQARLQVIEAAVVPRVAALSKSPVRYNSSCDNSAAAAVRADARTATRTSSLGNSIAPSVLLDEPLIAIDSPIIYLRISARSAEGFALASMSGTIASPRRQPRMIGIELHVRQARELVERLHKHGYGCAPFAKHRWGGFNWTGAEWDEYLRSQARGAFEL
ncbi:MAG: hypothetical protein SGPRY_011175 [Prymnesium sp.]